MCKALRDSVSSARLHMFAMCPQQHHSLSLFNSFLGGCTASFDCEWLVPLESYWYIWSYSNNCSSTALKEMCSKPHVTSDIFLPDWKPAAEKPLFRLSRRQAGSHANCSRPFWMDADCHAVWSSDAHSGPADYWCHKNMLARTTDIRRLCTCEEEALIGMPMDFTDAISRIHAEELNIRECRRKSVVASCVPFICAHNLVTCVISPFQKPTAQYHEPVAQLRHLYSSIFDECPYNMYYKAVHGHRQTSCGPDAAELNSHQSAFLALATQDRRHTSAVGHVGSVPRGLPPLLHVQVGCAKSSPLDEPAPVPGDQMFALSKCAELGPHIDKWRKEQFEKLEGFLKEADVAEPLFASHRSPQSRRVAAHLPLARHHLLCASLSWPDTTLTDMLCVGGATLGPHPEYGIFRAKETTAQCSKQDLLKESAAYIDMLVAKQQPNKEQVDLVWSKSLKEIEQGTLRGFWTRDQMDQRWGRGNWVCLTRYPIEQKGASRMIDNGKLMHNRAYGASETIHTTSSAAAAASARALRKLKAKPLKGKWMVQGSSKDMKGAYRQIPRHPSEADIAVVVIWSPVHHRWMFAEGDALFFGESGAVLLFNRVPTFLAAVARRWLAIPAQHFFDDFRLLGFACSKGSEFAFFTKLMGLLRWKFDPEKDQLPTSKLLILGNIEEYESAAAADAFLLSPKRGRVEELRAAARQMLECKHIQSSLSFRGKLLHLSSTMPLRVGRGFMQGLNEVIMAGSNWSDLAEDNLHFILAILDLNLCKSIPLCPTPKREFRVWVDASARPSPDGDIVKICAIVVDLASGTKTGAVSVLPLNLVQQLCYRKSQILIGELCGPILAVLRFPSVFKNASGV